MYLDDRLARDRHGRDLAQADERRLALALTAHRRASRRHQRADRALARAGARLATATVASVQG